MSRKEAEADGINVEFRTAETISYLRESPRWIYRVPCALCGKEFESVTYSRKQFKLCPECRKKTAEHRKRIRNALVSTHESQKEKRFNQAVHNIKKQVREFKQYEKAVNGARKGMDKYGSVPEAMTAIELLRLGYPFIPQQRVKRYRVDFYIKKKKTVIEIDGSVYHHEEDHERDLFIQCAFGFETKILHIPAETIQSDVRLLSRIIDKRNEIAVITGCF